MEFVKWVEGELELVGVGVVVIGRKRERRGVDGAVREDLGLGKRC